MSYFTFWYGINWYFYNIQPHKYGGGAVFGHSQSFKLMLCFTCLFPTQMSMFPFYPCLSVLFLHQACGGGTGSVMDRLKLSRIDEELESSEVAALCFLCRDVVTAKRLEGVSTTYLLLLLLHLSQPHVWGKMSHWPVTVNCVFFWKSMCYSTDILHRVVWLKLLFQQY